MAHPPKVEAMLSAFLGETGALARDERQAIVGGGEVPAGLRAYVDKVARHAYRVTDEDFAALRAAGYTDDQIFEATIAAALHAGLSRLRIGRRAIGRDA
jgi:alkylhydroperoxidase family enzyme